MSAVSRLPAIAGITSVGALAAFISTFPSTRAALSHYTGLSKLVNATSLYRTLTLLLLLINLKNVPFVWHLRLFRGMIHQLYLQSTPLPRDALFKPIVTSLARTSMFECDYNLHKSNSTYFSDLDMARTQLVSCLLRKGIMDAGKREREADEEGAPQGRFVMAMGAVTCHFKKEIKPYEAVEIWTRVLSWDRKWFYMVSHIVKKGAVKPEGWVLQPWRKVRGKKVEVGQNGHVSKEERLMAEEKKKEKFKTAIFASSIAKYVVKKGRLTISPEVVWQHSDLLPPKPENIIEEMAQQQDVGDLLDIPDNGDWTWENVEKERLRGLRLAEKFAALDGLHNEFPCAGNDAHPDAVEVLGEFADMLW